jgi:hypothetical protein
VGLADKVELVYICWQKCYNMCMHAFCVCVCVCVRARAHSCSRTYEVHMYVPACMCVSLQFVKICFRFLSHVRNWKVFHWKIWVSWDIVTTFLNSAELWNFARIWKILGKCIFIQIFWTLNKRINIYVYIYICVHACVVSDTKMLSHIASKLAYKVSMHKSVFEFQNLHHWDCGNWCSW